MIVALQLKPQLLSHYEQLLAIVAGNRREKGQRPGCQLLRSIAAPTQQRTRFRERPDVTAAAPRAFKKEILTIARPVSTALLRRLVPSRWKYRTKSLAVGLHFPQRGNVFLCILQREAHATAVGRETQVHGGTRERGQLPSLAAVRPDHVQVGTVGIQNGLAIGGPGGGVSKHIAHPARRACRNGQLPQRRLGLGAAHFAGYQQRRMIRRNVINLGASKRRLQGRAFPAYG